MVRFNAMVLVLAMLSGCEKWRNKEHHEKSAAKSGQKSLYDRLGGEKAIRAVVDDFVPRAASNPKVNFARQGVPGVSWQPTESNVQHLKEMLVQFIGSATGGPMKYTGKDMKTSHRGMRITNAEFDAIAGDLQASLTKLSVPPNEAGELMAIVATTRKDMVEQ